MKEVIIIENSKLELQKGLKVVVVLYFANEIENIL